MWATGLLLWQSFWKRSAYPMYLRLKKCCWPEGTFSWRPGLRRQAFGIPWKNSCSPWDLERGMLRSRWLPILSQNGLNDSVAPKKCSKFHWSSSMDASWRCLLGTKCACVPKMSWTGPLVLGTRCLSVPKTCWKQALSYHNPLEKICLAQVWKPALWRQTFDMLWSSP